MRPIQFALTTLLLKPRKPSTMHAVRHRFAPLTTAQLAVFTLPLLLALAGPQAEAALVVSNLGKTLGDAWTIGSADTDLTDSPVANRFTTGAGPGWHLDSVVLRLGLFEGSACNSGDTNNGGDLCADIDLLLAADNAGKPGAAVASLPSVAPSSPVQDFTLSPLSATLLAPNTDYWLVTSANVDDGYQWNFTEETGQTGLPGWLIGDTAWGGYPTGNWTPLILPPGATPAPTLFQVNASAVPEPSSLALFGVASLSGIAVAARRRRKQAAA